MAAPPGTEPSILRMDRTTTPADPRAAHGGRLESSLLALKEVSVLLVDCMKTPGLNGLVEQSYTGIEVKLTDGDQDPELRAQIDSCEEEEGVFQMDGGSDEDECLSESSVQKTKSQRNQKHVTAAERRRESESGATASSVSMTTANGAVRNRQEPQPHRCDNCGKSFVRRSNLVRHQRHHCSETETPRTERHENGNGDETVAESPRGRGRRHSCAQCDKSFAKEKPFTCEKCGKACSRRADLRVHMMSHSEERPYGCSHCAKSFKQLVKLKQHERIHTGEKPYQCGICSKSFRIRVSLAAHRYTHTGEKPFKCPLCSKAFSDRNNLKKHQIIHTGEKPYRCSYCGKSCRLLQHLVIHERGHTGEKPYTCDLCGKGYSHLSTLKAHQVSHRERPPRCHLCGQEFADLTELTNHDCEETSEKPHRCPECGKCFSQASNLKKHQLIHSGEKPFGCKDCGKQFNHKSNLTKHTRIHTDERPFECEQCARSFRLLQHLTNHRLTHRKQDQTGEAATGHAAAVVHGSTPGTL